MNFTTLIEFLTNTFGDKKFEIDFTDTTKRPIISHKWMMDSVGIFKHAIGNVSIGFFSFGKTETGYWGTICIFYQALGGGSNGIEVASVWYDSETEKWTIKTK